MTRPGPGKFEANDSQEVSELLNAWVQNGLVDDQCTPYEGEWFGLITIADGDEAYAELIKADNDAVTSHDVGILVHEDANGFFTYELYESFEAARTVFEEWQQRPLRDLIDHVLRSSDIVWPKYGTETVEGLTARIVQVVKDNTTYEGE